MKTIKFFLILTTIFNCLNLFLTQSDDLIELNCLDETNCKQFEHSGIKSTCIEEQCQCTSSNGDITTCQPMNYKMNNIIGGPCPCKLKDAVCDKQQDVCYCKNDYMPSSDKRRCIPKVVPLGGKCELDSQCDKVDFNAICDESKECTCMDQFVNVEGRCSSIVGNKSICTNDTQCLEHYGANTKCNNLTQHCICISDHFSSIDNSHCLKISKYLENCSENMECIGTMGPGGKCVDGVCQCSEKYLVTEKKTKDNATETLCTAVVERGHYCRYDEDCYQIQLNESEQTMDCIYGECNCKKGFNFHNEGDCVRSGLGAKIKSVMKLKLLFGLIAFIICI